MKSGERERFQLRSSTVDPWLEAAIPVLRQNAEFCGSNQAARETRTELSRLMNDGVDHIVWIAKFKDWHQIRTWSSTANYVFSMLFPLAQGIYLDFLAGNVPSCFMQLRMLVEQVARCLRSDVEYPREEFFQDRLDKLEAEMRRTRQSLSNLISSLDSRAVDLWRELSNRWVHMRRFEPIVQSIMGPGVPGYALTVPSPYTLTDVQDIAELGAKVTMFRKVLIPVMEKWKASIAEPMSETHSGPQ